MKILFYKIIFSVFAISSVFAFSAETVQAQRNDHLTEKEAELVRDAQEIDRRMSVFVKTIERRFLVLENKTESLTKKESRQLEKDSEKWGDLPDSSGTKLLSDIENILNEAINNLDDAASRDSKSDLFPKAVYLLADSSKDFIPRLKNLYNSSANEREKAIALQAIEYSNMIIEAASRVERPVDKKAGKKKKS